MNIPKTDIGVYWPPATRKEQNIELLYLMALRKEHGYVCNSLLNSLASHLNVSHDKYQLHQKPTVWQTVETLKYSLSLPLSLMV